MKIERDLYPRMSLEEFANTHGLTLKITERVMDEWQRRNGIERFTAQFDGVEVGRDGILSGVYGNGNTESEAIADYVRKISRKPRLVVDAMKPTRRDIYRVPDLSYES